MVFTGMTGSFEDTSIGSRSGTPVRAQRQRAIVRVLLGRAERPLPARRVRHHADVSFRCVPYLLAGETVRR